MTFWSRWLISGIVGLAVHLKKGNISTWEIRYDWASFSGVRATTGELATIACVIQTLYINGRFVNKIHMGEGFAHLMQ